MKPNTYVVKSKFVITLLTGLLLALIIAVSILSFTPPVSRDALTHHLAIPELYIQHGSIYEIPELRFSYYPMNIDLLYMIPLYFGNDIIPKYIHFSFALFTAALIFLYIKKRLNIAYGLVGMLFFLSLPIIVQLSTEVYVDLGLIFFSFASIYFLFKWEETDFKLKNLFLSAFFCGLCLGTKYNGLIVLLILTAFVMSGRSGPRLQQNFQFSHSLRYGLFFFFISILFFSPWMIRNYAWTHNPIYPLFDHLICPERQQDVTSVDMNHFLTRRLVFKESWVEILTIPIRIFFQGIDRSPQYFDGKLNPFLFFLPFFAFIPIKKRYNRISREKMRLAAFSVLFILFVFFQRDMRIRYIGPAIPPLIVLSVLGLDHLYRLLPQGELLFYKILNPVILCIIVVCILVPNSLYLLNQFNRLDPFAYISGRISRDQYIEKYRPEYPVIQYANNYVPENAKIYMIFMGNRGYYCHRKMDFDFLKLKTIVSQSKSPADLAEFLRQIHISYLMINVVLFNDWINHTFELQEKKILKSFFKNNVQVLYSKNNFLLYRLKVN